MKSSGDDGTALYASMPIALADGPTLCVVLTKLITTQLFMECL